MPRCALRGVFPPDPGVIAKFNIDHSSALMQSRYALRRSLDQAVCDIFFSAFRAIGFSWGAPMTKVAGGGTEDGDILALAARRRRF
jgi:hypothetical protein